MNNACRNLLWVLTVLWFRPAVDLAFADDSNQKTAAATNAPAATAAKAPAVKFRPPTTGAPSVRAQRLNREGDVP